MKKIVAGLMIGLFTSSAFAWGAREQGIVTGVAGLWVAQQLYRAANQPTYVQQPPVYVMPQQQAPVIMYQPQQYCESSQVIDQFGVARLVQYCYYR